MSERAPMTSRRNPGEEVNGGDYHGDGSSITWTERPDGSWSWSASVGGGGEHGTAKTQSEARELAATARARLQNRAWMADQRRRTL